MSFQWTKIASLSRRQLYHNTRERQSSLSTSSRFRLAASSSQQQQQQQQQLSPERFFSSSSTSTTPAVFKALSTRLEDVLQDALWLIPRKGTGFDNFLPKGKKEEEDTDDPEKEQSSESESGKDIDDGDEASATKKKKKGGEAGNKDNKSWTGSFGPFRFGGSESGSGSGSGGSGSGSGGNVPPNFTNTIMTGVLLLFFTYIMMKGVDDDGTSATDSFTSREITWNDFCNHLLETGQVEKIVVTNSGTMAKVFLKPGSSGLPQHQSRINNNFRYSDRRQQASNGNNGNGSPHFEETTKMSSDEFNNANHSADAAFSNKSGSKSNQQQIVYRFAIGSVDAFEKKLEEAQRVIGQNKSQEIPVQYTAESTLASEVMSVVPSLLLMGAAFYFMRFAAGSMMGGGGAGGKGGGGGMGGMFQIGKSTHKKVAQEDVHVDFSSVAGCDEAKKEIMEFVDFLKEPDRFTKLGAKIPKGALLCGPPGTGKTLLARAVAGEAGVPFFTISGSDFIEMFVGVGPSRVRDLFKEARENTPCIIFIDEIDAVGRQRGRGGAGGNDERENTLNQLLVEMDGFESTTGVVVLAGTNRADILDQALTRPGRFDRQIVVDKPDLNGRKQIFQVHLKGITLEGSIEDVAGRLAGLTPGFAGADIANICNEAAIVAARRNGESVSIEDFEKATDRIIGGLESNKIMSKEEQAIVAHHEAGHAVAGWFLEHADPLLKVTIIPRTSGALGFAQYLPREVYLQTNEQIMDIVCMALAGRAAEEVFFGGVTTGASDDLRRVTDIVYSTIQVYGMNERLGQLAFPKDPNAMFDERPYSEKTAKAMDEEAKQIVDEAYQRTMNLILEHKDDVQKVADLLLEKETITHDDVWDLVGPRPFAGDAAYDEYISRRTGLNSDNKAKDSEIGSSSSEEPLNPGLA